MLAPWNLLSGSQYWLGKFNKSFSIMEMDFNYVYHASVWFWWKCKHSFLHFLKTIHHVKGYIVLTSACQPAILLDKHPLTSNYVALFYIMRWHINSYVTHCRLGMDMICSSIKKLIKIFKILSSSIRFSCITNKKTLFGILLPCILLIGIRYSYIHF